MTVHAGSINRDHIPAAIILVLYDVTSSYMEGALLPARQIRLQRRL